MLILNKIQWLIYFGVILEICFIALTLSILLSELLSTPEGINLDNIGTLIYLYVSSMLQFLSLFVVIKLFRDVKSKEILNLIWIQRIGNKRNKINQNYTFYIPENQKLEDDSKKKFEKRINMNFFF